MLGCAAVAAGSRQGLIGTTLGLAAFAALALAPGAGARANGFKFGVTAADVTSDSAILWANASRSGTAEIQIVRRGGFGRSDPETRPWTCSTATTNQCATPATSRSPAPRPARRS